MVDTVVTGTLTIEVVAFSRPHVLCADWDEEVLKTYTYEGVEESQAHPQAFTALDNNGNELLIVGSRAWFSPTTKG